MQFEEHVGPALKRDVNRYKEQAENLQQELSQRKVEVEEARGDERLALVGHHPFSRYELIFEIEDLGAGRSRLRAVTNAAFPGLHGRISRALVIGSGAHRVLARHMLGKIAGRARG